LPLSPLKVHKVTNPWRSPSGMNPHCPSVTYPPPTCRLPALKTHDDGVLFQPSKIITHLRKQKYNADYDLSAKQGADTLAFISLLEEKLLPALIHSFWVEGKNYVEHTRRWYAESIPFPLNFFLPNQMHKRNLERLQLIRGDSWREEDEDTERQVSVRGRGPHCGGYYVCTPCAPCQPPLLSPACAPCQPPHYSLLPVPRASPHYSLLPVPRASPHYSLLSVPPMCP
uniref:Mitochondrial outer membrane transport complex Sam37/metaxin N-terminal domain-containing protein n=1 Tax=Xenopus tropicalis TaxID=8364 RepID=A0A803JZL5_XENTR